MFRACIHKMLQFIILWSVLSVLQRLVDIQKQLDGIGKSHGDDNGDEMLLSKL